MTHARTEPLAHSGSSVRVLIDADTIARRVRELGAELSREYAGRKPVLVGVLKGAVVFLADLVRAMDIDLEVDFVSLASYGSRLASTGKVQLVHDLRDNIEGRDVLLIEGIVDSGHSLHFILDHLEQRRPRSLKVCALLDKAGSREVAVTIDYRGFRIGDDFVVGYGMDAAETYRQLPYVGVVAPARGGTAPME